MPNIEGAIFDTPRSEGLLVPAAGPQKFAVASAYQREATFYQADRSIAQIVRLPGAIRHALFAEQSFGGNAIAATRRIRIERADGGAQALAPLLR